MRRCLLPPMRRGLLPPTMLAKPARHRLVHAAAGRAVLGRQGAATCRLGHLRAMCASTQPATASPAAPPLPHVLSPSFDDASTRVELFQPIYDELARGQLISPEDLSDGIQRALPDATISGEQIERMFKIGDLDRSGRIDFQVRAHALFSLSLSLTERVICPHDHRRSLSLYSTTSQTRISLSRVWPRGGLASSRPSRRLR